MQPSFTASRTQIEAMLRHAAAHPLELAEALALLETPSRSAAWPATQTLRTEGLVIRFAFAEDRRGDWAKILTVHHEIDRLVGTETLLEICRAFAVEPFVATITTRDDGLFVWNVIEISETEQRVCRRPPRHRSSRG